MKKTWAVIGIVAMLVLAAGCSSNQAGNDADDNGTVYGQYRSDLYNTGVVQAAGLPELAGEKWQVDLQGKTNSSPVLAGDTLYIGDEAGVFHALNAADGTTKWTFKAEGRIRSSAAIAGSRVYFLDRTSTLYALDTNTGEPVWIVKLDDALAIKGMGDAWDYYYASPAIDGDILYIGSEGLTFYAINRKDGSIKWEYESSDKVHGKAVVANNKVYIADMKGEVAALDQTSGEKLWSQNYKTIHSSAAYKDGVLYYGSRDQYVYAVDAESGEELWKHQSPKGSWMGSSPAVSEEYVTIGSSDAMVLHIFERDSGKHHFDFDVESRIFSSPAITGTVAYFGTAYTENQLGIDAMFAVDLQTGKELWRFDGTGAPILASPAVGDGVVYYASQDGYVFALH